jgi:SAM-dependent methyltransferase
VDHQKLYEYRFRDVDQNDRQRVWNIIAAHVYERMGRPQKVVDPAAGRCEFINAIAAQERWVVDAVNYAEAYRVPEVKVVVANALDVELPASHFDGVFVSNFLEHLDTPEEVHRFLLRMRACLEPGGRIAIMGPNFKYCAPVYFDCADHVLALSHVSIEEHLYAAGYEILRTVPRFLPFSFRGILPPSPALTRLYLGCPWAWPLLGKQFIVYARRPSA